MNNTIVKEKVEKLIELANNNKHKTKLVIIASTKNELNAAKDYNKHSVTTSYLSRQELDELVHSFRKYCSYLEVYTDIEKFLKDYSDHKLKVHPNIIFETSAKGIGRGKDALIPTMCDLLNLAHIGSEATSNIICSCKYHWSCILDSNGINVPKSYLFNYGQWSDIPLINKKYILKLNYECASIGLSYDSVINNIDGNEMYKKAIQLQKDYQQPVIAQEFIEGYEVEVPVLINSKFCVALPPVGLAMENKKYFNQEFFDYDNIYSDDYTLYNFGEINQNMSKKLQQVAKKIIYILDLSGYMRIDFRVNKEGEYYVIDINNDPCINSCGSFQKSMEFLGLDPQDISGVLVGNRIF